MIFTNFRIAGSPSILDWYFFDFAQR